eukprot:1675724-Rhodomonas_salina.3
MTLDNTLFCPTRERTGWFRQPSPSGFRATGSLQTALKTLFEDCRADQALVKQFTWHSLRSGGASWAFRNNVPLKTVMLHGVWKSAGGIKPYIATDLATRLQVTSVM